MMDEEEGCWDGNVVRQLKIIVLWIRGLLLAQKASRWGTSERQESHHSNNDQLNVAYLY